MVAHPEVVSVGELDVTIGLIALVGLGGTTAKDCDHTLGEGGETLVDAVADAGAQPVEEDEEKHPEEDPQRGDEGAATVASQRVEDLAPELCGE